MKYSSELLPTCNVSIVLALNLYIHFCITEHKQVDMMLSKIGSPDESYQTRRSGQLLRLGFNEIAQFQSKSEVLVALSIFSSPYFFHQ